jgi:NADP-dependent 3-hydroxy acid dehydrogenase YdfG
MSDAHGMSGIEGKVVIVTGASSGIGEATALLLAERRAKVVLGARGQERLAALADRIVGAGGDAAYAPTDVRRREDLSALVTLAREQYGKLDVLINNAGVMPVSPLDDLRVEDWAIVKLGASSKYGRHLPSGLIHRCQRMGSTSKGTATPARCGMMRAV